jgi:hypothetical protein
VTLNVFLVLTPKIIVTFVLFTLLDKILLNVNVNTVFMHLPILVFVYNVLKNVQNVLMKHTVNLADLFLSEMSLHLYVLV